METDHSQIVLLEELLERPGHPVDFVSLPVLPNEDIVVVSVVARPPEGLRPLLLLRLRVEQHALDDAHGIERQCPERFLRLGGSSAIPSLSPFTMASATVRLILFFVSNKPMKKPPSNKAKRPNVRWCPARESNSHGFLRTILSLF